MVCQECFIFLLQSSFQLIYASMFCIDNRGRQLLCGVSVLFLQHEFPAVVGDTGICQNYEFSSMDIVIQSCIHF